MRTMCLNSLWVLCQVLPHGRSQELPLLLLWYDPSRRLNEQQKTKPETNPKPNPTKTTISIFKSLLSCL